MIIHDIDFNPYNDKQAEDRCHRIGQENEVTVYRFCSLSTVEEGMLKIAEEKLRLGRDISSTEAVKKGTSKSYFSLSISYVFTLFLFSQAR